MNNQLSIIPLGGIGDVTKNMYVYEYNNEILIVDCGLGFADETMLGVDLLLPDITYLQSVKKRIVGMVFTHGHEDHIGALPFILPQLPEGFPLLGSPLTAMLANEKLKEFGVNRRVQTVDYKKGPQKLGSFAATFIHVTHSIPDTSHIFIETSAGNFYHGSDFKIDKTPWSGKTTDIETIKQVAEKGVVCLLSDCLGSERDGWTVSESNLIETFRKEIRQCSGRFILTTYSSNIARMNQIIKVSEEVGRRVCFVGRSFTKVTEVAKKLGYLQIKKDTEIQLDELKKYPDKQVTLIVAGSQGQQESALARIANGEHREIFLTPTDTVIFSADPIPGNEVSVYELIDTLSKKGIRVLYSNINDMLHVSGHGAWEELRELITLVKPKKLFPIGGAYRHMFVYKNRVAELGYKGRDVVLPDNGQEIVFSNNTFRFGKAVPIKSVYVDEISGEELDTYLLRDRQKLSEGGIAIVMCEIDANSSQMVGRPDLIVRGFTLENTKQFMQKLYTDIQGILKGRKGRVTNWVHLRKAIGDMTERRMYKDFRRRPLVLPIVIEV